jgi:hypothetical protein
LFLPLRVRLRTDLVAYGVGHRARSEPHRVRQQRLGYLDCPSAEEGRGNLNESPLK